jgi:biotin synthase-related radical SAM superfamily protein
MTTEERFERIEGILDRLTAGHIELEAAQLNTNKIIDRLSVTVDRLATETKQRFDELRDMQKHTDDKVNILIDTVDRFIRKIDERGGIQS